MSSLGQHQVLAFMGSPYVFLEGDVMLENMDILQGKIKIGDASHEIPLQFSCVYKEWIQKLLKLIQKIGYEQNRYYLCAYQNGLNFIEQPEYSFLGTSITAINQFLYVLIKDELSNATGNFVLPYLCKNISTGGFKIDYQFSLEHTGHLLKNDFNNVIGPYFLDTYFGFWSCFENAIISITKSDETVIKEELENRKFIEFKKFISKNLFAEIKDSLPPDKIENIIEEKRKEIIRKNPTYISFPDRTNYLFKKIKKYYTRNIQQDKETLLFLGALRNTVHNNGKHLKENMQIELGGKSFLLEKNKYVNFEHYIDSVILLNELFDIYCEILRYVTQQKITEQHSQ